MARRSGLGKGLGALIPTDPDPAESVFQEIDISHIVPNPYQPREHFDEETLASLAASIAEVGVVQPVIVRKTLEGYEIIAGERRWRAAQRAGLRKVPALVRDADDKVALEAAVVENVHREDLNALEEAAAYRQLMDDFGLTQSDVAARVGRSRSTVANTVRLLNLIPAVQRLVVEGCLSAGHGRALLTIEDETVQQSLAEEIVRECLTVRETERRAAEVHATAEQEAASDPVDGEEPSADGVTAGVLELEELLSARLDTRVSVKLGKSRGRITIEFSGLADLERIYHLIM